MKEKYIFVKLSDGFCVSFSNLFKSDESNDGIFQVLCYIHQFEMYCW